MAPWRAAPRPGALAGATRLVDRDSVECEDAELVMAAREARTLTSREEAQFLDHLATCARCRQASTARPEDEWRWIARVPQDVFEAGDGDLLPIIDPGVFEIERELAAGGMGRILRARDRRLGRVVAIKEVLDRDLHARFEREALITARLQHPAIVPIYEAGTWPDGVGFYTMRLVPGGTLQAAIEGARLLSARLALLHHVVAMTEAVAYAHAQRIIHRDLKPSNVLVGELGETVVIDWGLAKELDRAEPVGDKRASWRSSDLTRVGAVMGTPGFMAPEQARGEPLDERADVYALGSILYALLAGVPPYAEELAAGTPDHVVDVGAVRPARSIDELAPEAPADLRAIVRRAMAWRKADRYPTAREMAEQLRRFEAGQLLARQYGVRELIGRWIRRHRAAVAVGALALLVVLVVAALAVVNIGRSRAAERVARQTAERALVVNEASFAALLEEQGRSAVLGGDRERGLVYLSEALRRGRDTTALRHLLSVATRDRDLLRATLGPIKGFVEDLAFTADGHVVTLQEHGRLARWSGAALVHTHELGHGVVDARFGPGATSLVVIGEDAALAMWDVATGTRRWRHADVAHHDAAMVMTFDPTGDRFAYARPAERVVVVFEVATGRRLARLEIAHGTVTDLAFSPDGQRLGVSTSDAGLGVWSTSTSTRDASWRAATAQRRVLFTDEHHLVTMDGDQAQLWRIDRAELLARLPSNDDDLTKLVVHPGAQLIVTTDKNGVLRSWTFDGRSAGSSYHPRGRILDLHFSPDGQLLAGAAGGDQLFVWDTATLALVWQHDADVLDVVWSGDGARLAATTASGSTLVWARPTGNRRARISSARAIVAGDRWLTNDPDGAVVRATATGAELARFAALAVGAGAGSWQVSQDGRRVLISGATATVLELPAGLRIASLESENAELSADGRRVAQLDFLDAGTRLRISDAATGSLLAERMYPTGVPGPVDVAVSPDGATVAVLFKNRPWAIWRADDLAPRNEALPSTTKATEAEFDPAGRLVIFGRLDRKVTVHDPATGEVVAELSTRDDAERVRFSARGDHLAFQTSKDTVELYALATPGARVLVENTTRDAFAVAPDGARLATGHNDGTIQLWESATGRLLEVLRGHRLSIENLAFSADGGFLLAQSTDGTASIWELPLDRRPAAEIARLAEQVGWTLVDGALLPKR